MLLFLKSLLNKIMDPGILLYITFMRPSFAIQFEHKRNDNRTEAIHLSSVTEECHFANYTSRYNDHAHSCFKKPRKP
jgi:hypothetical protein